MSSSWSRISRIATFALGATGGATVYWYTSNYLQEKKLVFNSWTTNYECSPCGKWDKNWDHRDPKSLIKPLKDEASPDAQNLYNEALETRKPKVTRHLILIRHGQYNIEGVTDSNRYLTELGRQQAVYSGERLKELKIPIDEMVRSTMTRAQETGKIIAESFEKLSIKDCFLLEEGAPIPPEPPVGHWRPEASQFFEDGSRIEAAFRKYFHRADATQKKDSYTLLVCHANVIRYFVCRALQFPAEGWLRISLGHASITWISITPTGRIILRSLGDTGHMPPELLSR